MTRLAPAWAVILAASALLPAAAEAGSPREFQLYRPSRARFYFDYGDADGVVDRVFPRGSPGDVGLLSDVDGDTVADVVLFRSGLWFVDLENDGTVDRYFGLGTSGDMPVVGAFAQGDQNGFGVYRPSTGYWYIDTEGDGVVDLVSPFGGVAGDLPVVADYDGDGRADRAIYRSGTWYVDLGFDGTLDRIYYLGGLPQDVPIAADFDGDWKADQAVFRDGVWYIDYGNDSTVDRIVGFGMAGDQPLFRSVNPAGVYVRAGATGGDGTQARPFGTIAEAVAAVPEPMPATIRIAAGTYDEPVALSNRHDLTLLGAGVNATHLQPSAGDAIVVTDSQGIGLRNLHPASLATDGGRAVVAQGSVLTLDRVSTLNSRGDGVVALPSAAAGTMLTVENSNLDASQLGNGLSAAGEGVAVLVRRTTMDRNGWAITDPSSYTVGASSNPGSTLTVEASTASGNASGGVSFSGARLIVHDTTIAGNRRYGVSIGSTDDETASPAELYANRIEGQPTGVDVDDLFTPHARSIHDNRFFRNGTAVAVRFAYADVVNNWFYDNGVAVRAAGDVISGFPTFQSSVSVVGNLIEVPLSRTDANGVILSGYLYANIGPGQPNTFRNITGDGAGIRCTINEYNGGPPNATCRNVFENVTHPVVDCSASCNP